MLARVRDAAVDNPATTIVGLLTLVSVLALELISVFDSSPETTPDWNLIVVSITTFIGLLVAKDGGQDEKQTQ